jgi:hypothetical protein
MSALGHEQTTPEPLTLPLSTPKQTLDVEMSAMRLILLQNDFGRPATSFFDSRISRPAADDFGQGGAHDDPSLARL